MPLLKIQTNLEIGDVKVRQLLQSGSALIVEGLGKPLEYVQVQVESGVPMSFSGKTDPTAMVEVRSLGLPEERLKPLCRSIFQLLRDQLGLPQDRVFINLLDLPRRHWGWNGDTFG